jgi:hypothetical protein
MACFGFGLITDRWIKYDVRNARQSDVNCVLLGLAYCCCD